MLRKIPVGVAFATSILLPLLIMLPRHGVISAEDDSLEEFNSLNGTSSLQAKFIKPKRYFMNEDCEVKCNPSFRQQSYCRKPPSRQEFCRSTSSDDWCCQEWLSPARSVEHSLRFTENCRLPCVAGFTCPYPKCRYCQEINWQHECCKHDESCRSPDDEADVSMFRSGAKSIPNYFWLHDNCEVLCTVVIWDQWKCNHNPPSLEQMCKEKYPGYGHHCCERFKPKPPPPPPPPPPPKPAPTTAPTTTTTVAPVVTTTPGPTLPTCPGVSDTICKSFDGRPQDCRLASDCAYNCAAETCQNSWEIDGKACFDGCWNHCHDRCGCKQRPGCGYDSASGICRTQLKRFCRLSNFPGNTCGRWGAFYLAGGTICESRVNTGHCGLDMVVISANLGSDKVAKDSQGIEYRPDIEIEKYDPFGLSQPISFPLASIKGSQSRDKELFTSGVVGNLEACTNETQQCVDYLIPTISWEGDYELAIRMHEGVYDEQGKRRFSAYFANVELFSELDILSLSKERFGTVDLIQHFRVDDQGKTITVRGHQPTNLGSHTKLSLCKGECAEDNNFLVNAFYIIKRKEEEIIKPCDISEPIKECEDFPKDACRRADVIYTFNGKFCTSTHYAGNCHISNVNLAINFNGRRVTDSRGIEYQNDNSAGNLVVDTNRIKLARETSGVLGVQDPKDDKLYTGIIYSNPAHSHPGHCVWYKVPLCQDGRYEVALRLVDDQSDAPGKRKFNVLISSSKDNGFLPAEPIMSEIDIYYLSGHKGKPVDVHVNLEVAQAVSVIRWDGGSENSEVPLKQGGSAWIGVCGSSSCKNASNANFMVAAMSVVTFGVDPTKNTTCAAHDGDPCGCKFETFCEYDVVADKCLFRKAVCKPKCGGSSSSGSECRRAGDHIYYVDAGKICQSKVDTMTGKCSMKEEVLAVNVGTSDDRPHKDVYGITFQAQSVIPFEDPNNTCEVSTLHDFLKEGVPKQDVILYNTHIWGNSQGGEERNSYITYNINLTSDGLHQLSLKLGESKHTAMRMRDYSITLNQQYIFKEFEAAQYRLPPYAFDVNTNFMVYGGQTKFKMDGHPPSDVVNGSIPLRLRFGTCSWLDMDPNFSLGAFSVIRLNASLPCALNNDNPCGCQFQQGCKYSLATGDCVEQKAVCQQVHGNLADCRRAGPHVFYAEGGLICNSPQRRGQCKIDESSVAENFDGPAYTDSNGIFFRPGITLSYTDPNKSLSYGSAPWDVEGVPEQDLGLYTDIIHGSGAGPGSCLTFTVPIISGDGDYELSLKLAQIWFKKNRQQLFDILINNQIVAKSVDIHSIRPAPKAFELNFHFKLLSGGSKIQVSGLSPTDITTPRSLTVALCNGDCAWPEALPSYSVGALSVVKYKLCKDFAKNPCGCRENLYCEYNVVTEQCSERRTTCEQLVYGNDQTCWRGGEHVFYSHGGVVCNQAAGRGNCQVDKVMLAINFGFNTTNHTDVDGITYTNDQGIPYNDPSDSRRVYHKPSRWLNKGIPSQDMILYNRHIWGAYPATSSGNQQTKRSQDSCLTYQIPTAGDGEYEISIKTGESWYNDTLPKRVFSYKFNGEYIVQEFEPAMYRLPPYAFQLNAQFKISGDKLTMRGGRESLITSADKKVPLQFCPGSCEWKGVEIDWHVSAFSVVKFKTAN